MMWIKTSIACSVAQWKTNKVSYTAKFSKICASTSKAKGRDFTSEEIISKAFACKRLPVRRRE